LSVARKKVKALSRIKSGLSKTDLVVLGLLLSAPEGVEKKVLFEHLLSHHANLTDHPLVCDPPPLSLLDYGMYPQKLCRSSSAVVCLRHFSTIKDIALLTRSLRTAEMSASIAKHEKTRISRSPPLSTKEFGSS
jgi:hypothetical protein